MQTCFQTEASKNPMDGIQAAEAIRSKCPCPVIYVTAHPATSGSGTALVGGKCLTYIGTEGGGYGNRE